ncbi:MAG: translation initiation factor IF-2 [Planctomycetota bacterium]
MGVRIHTLAGELNLTSKELLAILRAKGIKMTSHLSCIHEDIAKNIRLEVRARRSSSARAGEKAGEKAPAPPPPAPPPSVRAPSRGPLIVRSTTPSDRRPMPRGGDGAGGRAGRSGARGGGSAPAPVAPSAGGHGPPPAGAVGGKGQGRKVRFFPGDQGFRERSGERSKPKGPRPGARGQRRRGGRRGGDSRREPFRSTREMISTDRPSSVQVILPVTLKELSPIIGVRQNMIMKALMDEQVLVNVNVNLTEEMLHLIGEKFEVEINSQQPEAVESTIEEIERLVDPEESLQPRAPVVTFLGHVDHGKTSLLDKIRATRVAHGESGGITQHLSAYRVDQGGINVVFIDTPGHRAFTEMRARGANVTDVVVLVVAADDGPMPQTEEAIHHAQAAEVPIVVAINKVDKENANVDRTKQQLSQLGLAPPEWGGTTEMIEVSAITGQGIDELLELLSLETEILDLKANPEKAAVGTVLDARATTGRGIVATVLIQEGSLGLGSPIVCGPAWGKVRTMQSTTGVRLQAAPPATPAEITGIDELPEAGDRIYALESLNKAKDIAQERQRKKRAAERAERTHVTLDKLFEHISKGRTREINLILKTDVKGSLEVLRRQLLELSTEEVGIKILLGGVGEINESDVLLADASDAIIIGFHVVPNERARALADEKKVEIRLYQVIYQVLEEMKMSLEGLLEPDRYEELQSTVEIRELFRSTRLGNIAGCFVRSGTVRREDPVRLTRDGIIIYEGKLESLRRFKEDVREVKEGFECGLRIQDYGDIKVGDIIESHKVLEKARSLSDSRSSGV